VLFSRRRLSLRVAASSFLEANHAARPEFLLHSTTRDHMLADIESNFLFF
jgi:hypothetical protein